MFTVWKMGFALFMAVIGQNMAIIGHGCDLVSLCSSKPTLILDKNM